MFKGSSALMITVTALVALAVGASANGFFGAQSVRAQQEASRDVARKWEYCAITSVSFYSDRGFRGTGVAQVSYFQAAGTRYENIEDANGYNPIAVIARATAKLGDEGWEMVGEAPLADLSRTSEQSQTRVLYFKRPKS